MRRKEGPIPEEKEESSSPDDGVAKLRQGALRAASKIWPFGAQVLASAAAYTGVLTAVQVVGFCLRVSCITPVIAPLLGAAGVGVASALAGQASQQAKKALEAGELPLRLHGDMWKKGRAWWKDLDKEELLTDAVMGMALFKVLGGQFRTIMPSNLSHPGALAVDSLPARSDDYATPTMRKELQRLFKRNGCHHCGSRAGSVVGDHMPPNRVVYGPGRAAAKRNGKPLKPAETSPVPLLLPLQKLLGLTAPVMQRFFPQCQHCCSKQADALRNGKRVLQMHCGGYRPQHLAGIFVGLRYYTAPTNPHRPGRRRGWTGWNTELAEAAPLAGHRAGNALLLLEDSARQSDASLDPANALLLDHQQHQQSPPQQQHLQQQHVQQQHQPLQHQEEDDDPDGRDDGFDPRCSFTSLSPYDYEQQQLMQKQQMLQMQALQQQQQRQQDGSPSGGGGQPRGGVDAAVASLQRSYGSPPTAERPSTLGGRRALLDACTTPGLRMPPSGSLF